MLRSKNRGTGLRAQLIVNDGGERWVNLLEYGTVTLRYVFGRVLIIRQ